MLAHRMLGEFGKCFTSCKRNGIWGQVTIYKFTGSARSGTILTHTKNKEEKSKRLMRTSTPTSGHTEPQPNYCSVIHCCNCTFDYLTVIRNDVTGRVPIAWYHTFVCHARNTRTKYTNILNIPSCNFLLGSTYRNAMQLHGFENRNEKKIKIYTFTYRVQAFVDALFTAHRWTWKQCVVLMQ